MKVVLIRKLADCMDGVDVSRHVVGDVLDLPDLDARLLVAEQWATPERRQAVKPPPHGHERRGTGGTYPDGESGMEQAS